MKMILKLLTSFIFLLACSAPEVSPTPDSRPLSQEFNDYWYGGEAEISSYQLTQARYGELREGHAVLVFVTEPFDAKKLVKPNSSSTEDVSVLKLNSTKSFTTGVYPYSMMTSTFLPVSEGEHSMKISSSSQEWCGHTYMELENKDQFEIDIRSYFEDESAEITLDKSLIEDDVWTKIRLNPSALPLGNLDMIPSFFFLRLKHIETKSYSCQAELITSNSGSTYSINYPELNRELSITFSNDFPHEILSWEETYPDGWTSDSPKLTSKGEKIKTITSAYWNKNANSDASLRKELGLE